MLWLTLVEELMPRFHFHLTSKDSRISDDGGKELSSLNDAFDHARRLVEKIWLYTSHDDTKSGTLPYQTMTLMRC
jgi:hypothetical protein